MKNLITFIFIILTSILVNAQTAGNLTFSVTTTSTGNFSPKHVIAIWIEKADGTFIKTKLKRAATRVQYLNQWVAKSGSNVVDATTSATVSSHQTENITWNGTDVNGSIVPDGDYLLWIQMAWANTNGPTYSIPFTKGLSNVHLTPANQTNYLNMVLDWVANTTSTNEIKSLKQLSISPNPVKDYFNITYELNENSDVTLGIYDANAKFVDVVLDGLQIQGKHLLKINKKLKSGIYFIKIQAGKSQYSQKFIVL